MNFCTQEIGTTIVSSEVESDGYEAFNLLEKLRSTEKSNPEESSSEASCSFSYSRRKGRRNGYMAEYFVKPPVTVKLTFPLCIDISHIVLCPKIGNQQCSAFMVNTEVLEGWRKWQQRKLVQTLEEEQKRSTSTEIIGKEYINSTPVPELIVFRNPRFLLRPEFHSLPLGRFELHRNFKDAFELKHPCFNACEDVQSLEITVLRVTGSSSAALGSLQVWGQPSRQCSKSEIGSLLNKFGLQTGRRSKHRLETVGTEEDINTEVLTEALHKIPKTSEFPISPVPEKSTIVIPEDFLDPITFEVMCQPMRLPSGIAVDLVTLEKFETAEAQWGRPPKDPFTGKCFSETFKPVPDGALKSRIDSFLTTHSEVSEFRALPRTLGRSQTLISRPMPKLLPISKPTELSADNIETTFNLSIAETAGGPDQTSANIPPNLHQIPNLRTATATDRVSQELAKILRGSSSYLTKPKTTSSATTSSTGESDIATLSTTPTCLFCRIAQKSGSGIPTAFYKSSCGHVFLCRNCIVSCKRSSAEPSKSCTQCGLEWRAKEMQRSHE